MYHIEDVTIFVRVSDLGNLSAAGREMRMSAAVISNRIARLEKHLGVRLLNRTTRRVNLTPEGEVFYGYCVRILGDVEQAETAIAAQRDLPRGPLLVTTPTVFGRMHLVPLVPEFVDRYPDIQLRLQLSDRFAELIEEKVDLAIRIAELRDSTAIVRKIADDRRMIVGAPDYLDRHGTPEVPADLLGHNCLLLRFPGSRQFRWTLTGPDGPTTLPVSGSMDSDNGEAIREWCLAGHGLALKSLWEVGEPIRDGRLRVVLPDFPPASPPIQALYPHGHFLPPRVRALVDFLVEKLGPRPWDHEEITATGPG